MVATTIPWQQPPGTKIKLPDSLDFVRGKNIVGHVVGKNMCPPARFSCDNIGRTNLPDDFVIKKTISLGHLVGSR